MSVDYIHDMKGGVSLRNYNNWSITECKHNSAPEIWTQKTIAEPKLIDHTSYE